jgi:hypothetical protein
MLSPAMELLRKPMYTPICREDDIAVSARRLEGKVKYECYLVAEHGMDCWILWAMKEFGQGLL